MGRNETIQDAIDNQREANDWLSKLSDEKFVAFDVSEQIKELEYNLKYAKKQLASLKKVAKKLPDPPAPPQGVTIYSKMTQEAKYRFRGYKGRQVQEKLYGLPEGLLTDSGW